MPIVITPTNKGRDAMGGGGMDIGKTPPKDPGANKKMKKMVGKMEDMREYMDTLDAIEEGMKSKVFPKIFNDEGVMVADDPDSALELIADEITTQDVDMYMDAIRSGDNEALIDALDGFGYKMKFIGDPMSRYNEEDTTNEATWPKSDDDESAPQVGDTVMHDKHGLVKVLKITDTDMMGEPAEYLVQTKGGAKNISYDQLVMGESVEEDTLDEGKGSYKNMMIDIEDGMDKEEFEKEYPGRGDMYDEIKQEIIDRADEDIEMEDDCGCDEEAVDAMVSVPVQELQDILQLAGYENYSDKIQEYANEPEEEYGSIEDQMIGLSGGLNRPKKSYPASAPGDNPMDQEPREVEETMEAVEEKLYKSYKDFLEEAEIKVDEGGNDKLKPQLKKGYAQAPVPSHFGISQVSPKAPKVSTTGNDTDFDNVVKSRNEIKINKYLAKQDTKTANRLGKKYYGKDYDASNNPMRNR